MNKKHLTGIYSVLAMLTVWCIWNTANSGNLLNSIKSLNTAQQLVAREVAFTVNRCSPVTTVPVDATTKITSPADNPCPVDVKTAGFTAV